MTRTSQLRVAFWTIGIVLAAVQAWTHRFAPSSVDIVSYLDIADAWRRGDWRNAVSGYWAPLYPWLLGLTMALVEPAPYWEFPLVKAVNFLCYLAAAAGFEYLLCGFIAWYGRCAASRSDSTFHLPEIVLRSAGYLLFLWSALVWTTLVADTPDMVTAACVYTAAGVLLRQLHRTASWAGYVSFGAVLGLAYLSKAALFPISLVFLVVAAFTAGGLRRGAAHAFVAACAFAIVTGPYVAALSYLKGHFTFSESGKLAYVWLVQPEAVPAHYWQGKEEGYGFPLHAARPIPGSIRAFEFATPISGTYPTWYDPTYWYEGLQVRFDLASQIQVLLKNVLFAWREFLAVLLCMFLLLIARRDAARASVLALWDNAVLLVPAAAGLGVYFVVADLQLANLEQQPSMRYITPFVVLLYLGVLGSVRLRTSMETAKWLQTATIAAAVLVVVGCSLEVGKALISDRTTDGARRDLQIVAQTDDYGLRAGDRLAMMGGPDTIYWPRLARVKIVADISDSEQFWRVPQAERARLLEQLRAAGARAIVQQDTVIPDWAIDEGWVPVGETGVHLYFLEQRDGGRPPG